MEFFEITSSHDERTFVCFNPNGRWHGWVFRKHADGNLVSVRQLEKVKIIEGAFTLGVAEYEQAC